MTLLLIFILCIVLSGFFSSSEMAFVSSNRLKIKEMAEHGNRSAGRIMDILEYPHQFLTVILIANNIVNITATSVVAYWFEKNFQVESEWLVMAVTAPLLIIFGDTVPKDYGRLHSQAWLLHWSGVLKFLLKCFQLPALVILKGIDALLAPFGGNISRSIFVSEEEFRLLIEESVNTGVIGKHEKQLVDTILDFERIHVESVMTPVEKVAKISISDTIGKAKEIARQTNARMILVYEEIPSIIVGMIYVFDFLFEENESQSLKNYLRSPIFLSKNTSIEKAFLTLQQKRQSFAVVTDIHGEVIGIVPMERLFTL